MCKWLIATDLDGTLFNTVRQNFKRSLDTLHSVAERGHTLVIITGRSLHSAGPKLQLIPEGIRLPSYNGAYECDFKSQEILWANRY